MKPKTANEITLFATIIFGVAVLAIKAMWPEVYTPVFWVVPAFFYIYEMVFVWLLGRYDKMKAEKGVKLDTQLTADDLKKQQG